jgi:hypothetical protein
MQLYTLLYEGLKHLCTWYSRGCWNQSCIRAEGNLYVMEGLVTWVWLVPNRVNCSRGNSVVLTKHIQRKSLYIHTLTAEVYWHRPILALCTYLGSTPAPTPQMSKKEDLDAQEEEFLAGTKDMRVCVHLLSVCALAECVCTCWVCVHLLSVCALAECVCTCWVSCAAASGFSLTVCDLPSELPVPLDIQAPSQQWQRWLGFQIPSVGFGP